MLVKLVNDRETTILSGIDSVSIFYQKEENVKTRILSVNFKISEDKPSLNFVLSQETETEFTPVWEAFLMNDRGETIERLN